MDIGFKPVGEFILIKQDAKSDKMGSIIVTSMANRPPQSGIVLAVGSKCEYVQPNQRVQFELGEFQRVSLDGNEYILVKESKIIGIFDE